MPDNNEQQLVYAGQFVKEKLRTHSERDDVLTIEELAVYLKIPKSSLYKLVRAGRIPSQKIGRHWRFGKRAIDQWLQQPHSNQSDVPGSS